MYYFRNKVDLLLVCADDLWPIARPRPLGHLPWRYLGLYIKAYIRVLYLVYIFSVYI